MTRTKHIISEDNKLETFFIGSKNFNIGYDAGLLGKEKQLSRDIAVHNSDYGAGDAAHRSRGGHKGIDVFAERGEPVVSPVTGTVTKVTTQDSGAGGKTVTVEKDGISYYHAHLDRIFVKAGQTIKAGHLIGTVGNTGSARGTHPHVHFSMYYSDKGYDAGSINPWKYIKDAAYVITKSDNNLKLVQRKLKKAGFDLGDEMEQGVNGPMTQNALNKLRKTYSKTQTIDSSAAGISSNVFNTIKNILKTAIVSKILMPKRGLDTKQDADLDKLDKPAETIDFSTSSATVNPDMAAKIVMVFLKNKGLSTSQAAGIAGNMQIESRFNPKAVGDSGTSFGIVQWHGVNGDNLKAWCTKNGYKWDSLDGQLEFLWWELKNHQSKTLSALKTQTNPRDAAYLFAKMFERPAHIGNNRADAAEKIYDEYTKRIIKKIA